MSNNKSPKKAQGKKKVKAAKDAFVKQDNTPVYIMMGIVIWLFCCFVGCHIGTVMATSNLAPLEAVMAGLDHMQEAPFAISLNVHSFKAIGIATLLFLFAAFWFYIDGEKNKRSMPGRESGSAGWNTDLKGYNKRFTDPVGLPNNNGPYNMLLSQNISLSLNGRDTMRNNNVVVVGGSGSGKSRFFVKPNILQANTNYVITDPAGDLLESTGAFLQKQGYEIRVFNLVEMAKSDCYNPFNYIRDDLGVLMMINCLIKNTNPDGSHGGDPFWEKSETALLQALCFYLIKYRPKSEQNFTTVMKLLRAAEINEQNPNAKSHLDRLFEEVEKTDPNSIALKQYRTFKMGAGKTLKSILISCSVRLTVFNLHQIESLTNRDTIDLATMGEGKKALFVIIPAADSTYNFLVSMMYSQLFETLYYVAETQSKNKRLESHIRFLLDEFVNIGQIPEFTKKLATMRKYEISCNIILQNLAQLKTMYKDDWETIIGNCDTFLFLGGQEYSTLEYISKELGDQTIVVRNNSRSKGKSGSSSQSYNRSGRKLMFADEIMRMSDNYCILLIRGLKPFYGKKYEYTNHPNYKYTGDADPSLKYVNKINNIAGDNVDDLDVKYEQYKAVRYTKALTSKNPAHRVMGEVKPIEMIFRAIDINSAKDVFERFIVIPPDNEINMDEAIVDNLDEYTEQQSVVNDIDEVKTPSDLPTTEREHNPNEYTQGSHNDLLQSSDEKTSSLDDVLNQPMDDAQNVQPPPIEHKPASDASVGKMVVDKNHILEEWICDS